MRKILLIDDHPDVRAMLREVLSQAGHAVETAENGRAALPLLERDTFDLVITDMLMPEMDGVQLIQAARRLVPSVPILAISAGGMTSAQVLLNLSRHLGAGQVLPKPFTPAELLQVVNRALQQTSAPERA